MCNDILEKHITNVNAYSKNWEGDSDSWDDQSEGDDNLMLSDNLEYFASEIEPKMDEPEVNNESLLPEDYYEEEEPPKSDPNNNSTQEDNLTTFVFDRLSENSDYPEDPFYSPSNPMESKISEGNVLVDIEKDPGINYDLEEPSDADVSSFTSQDMWGLTPVDGSTPENTMEMDTLIDLRVTDDGTDKLESSNEIEWNFISQLPIRTSVIVSPSNNTLEEPLAFTGDNTFKKPLRTSRTIRSGLRGTDLFICGNIGCSFAAPDQQGLMNHMLNCVHARKSGRLSCPHCYRIFWYRNFFLIHLQHHGQNKFFCQVCGYGSPVKASVAKHMNLKHKGSQKKTTPDTKFQAFSNHTAVRPSTTQKPETTGLYVSGFHQALANTNQKPSSSNQHLLNTVQYQPDLNQSLVNIYQKTYASLQIIPINNKRPSVSSTPNTNQRPSKFCQNPLPIWEKIYDTNPSNANQQPQTTAKPKSRLGNKLRSPREEPSKPETRPQQSDRPLDELCCPLCRERFGVKQITLYQCHLYEEVRHRRIMDILAKAKANHNDFLREQGPNLEATKPILLTETPDDGEIMFWVNKNIKRQLHQRRQLKLNKSRA